MNWSTIVYIRLLESDGAFLHIDFGIIPVTLLLIGYTIYIFRKRHWMQSLGNWNTEEANIKLGGLGDIKIKPDYEDIQIAHRAWVELSTRKAGLEFDENDDVITEVYDSWYKLFGEMRDLVKQIPSRKIRNSKDTQQLIVLLVDALNNGLRPHLTKWQSRFRSWYRTEIEKYPGKCPQDIQKKYPEYKKLISELKKVNIQMVEYTQYIKKIAHGDLQ